MQSYPSSKDCIAAGVTPKYTSKLQQSQGIARDVRCLSQIYHNPFNRIWGCSSLVTLGSYFPCRGQPLSHLRIIRGEIETAKKKKKRQQKRQIFAVPKKLRSL